MKIIIFKVLKALLFANANGIMHRDIKPHNIAIDPQTWKVRLLDWGLADFYLPRQRYSSHVATRMFKPPELLIEYPYYDYSIDIWSLGVTFAIMLFGRTPVQCGENDEEQLLNVADFVGGKPIIEYAQSLNIELASATKTDLLRCRRKGIAEYVERTQKGRKVPKEAVELLEKMMTVDHRKRITAAEALKDPFFQGLTC
jgi:casein kinase II subunit alpha